MATPLIALDPGHGAKTPGKRSPAKLGEPILHEYAFNRAVAHYVGELLRQRNIAYTRVAPTDKDTPWNVRLANAKGCKLYISIHANAGFGTGIETFYSPGVQQSERLARLVQQHVIDETKMYSRGIKTANLWVTRETPKRGLTACLVELGFMDYLPDLQKLRQESYQRRCAVGIVKGVCAYLGIDY